MAEDVKSREHLELMAELHAAGWEDGEDPLTFVLPIGYLSDIVTDVRWVMHILNGAPARWYEEIATTLSLDPKYVHLILEMLARAGLTEYGSSPRGSWLTEKGKILLRMSDGVWRLTGILTGTATKPTETKRSPET